MSLRGFAAATGAGASSAGAGIRGTCCGRSKDTTGPGARAISGPFEPTINPAFAGEAKAVAETSVARACLREKITGDIQRQLQVLCQT